MSEIKNLSALIQREKTKIFTSNVDAIKFCNILRRRKMIPYKYIIVTWDEKDEKDAKQI